MNLRRLLLLLLLPLLAGCEATRGAVHSEVTSASDFSIYRTWDWDLFQFPPQNKIDLLVRASIERELAVRGYDRVEDGGQPDLYVRYDAPVGSEPRLQWETGAAQRVILATGLNSRPAEVWVTTSEKTRAVYETGLVRVVVQRGPGDAWHGMQTMHARGSVAPLVAETVSEIFDAFPAESRMAFEVTPEQDLILPLSSLFAD